MAILVQVQMAIDDKWDDDLTELLCDQFEYRAKEMIKNLKNINPNVQVEISSFSPITGYKVGVPNGA